MLLVLKNNDSLGFNMKTKIKDNNEWFEWFEWFKSLCDRSKG